MYLCVLGYKGKSGVVTQGKRAPAHARNAKILIIHYTANIFLRKLHGRISGGLLSLPSLLESLSIVVVEV
jgi:hypothetical protein